MKSAIFKASVFTLALDISLAIIFAVFIVPVINVSKINIIICTLFGILIGNLLNGAVFYFLIKHKSRSFKRFRADMYKLNKGKISVLSLEDYSEDIKLIAKNLNSFLENKNSFINKCEERLNLYDLIFNRLEQGIILLNYKKQVVFHNANAAKILGDGVSVSSDIKSSGVFCSHVLPMCEALYKSNKSLIKTLSLPNSKKTVEIYLSHLNHKVSDKGGIIIILTDISEFDRLKKTRDEFAANVTHELKTPLTSIIGYIELLSSEERDAETRKYFYDIIYSEAQKLFTLIDDMLLLAQVENMNDSSVLQKCNVKEEVDDTVKRFMPMAQKRNVVIEVNVEPNLNVSMSKIRMHQLFSNIISNAIKYNVDNGKIFINAYRERSNIIINIKDTGIGINPNHIDKIFERFYRSDTSRASGIPGTGLGLAIVKDIVKLYDGDIQVKSELNLGSEFIITFPIFKR